MLEGLDLTKLSQAFGDIQAKAKEMQDASAGKTFSAKSGGGMVSATVNGNSEVVDITIDDALLEDKESLQILVIAAINDCLRSVEENKKGEAMNMLGAFAPSMFGK
jgi:nucleoid-associated protein EbfC